jgi:hypothetical protein
MALVDFFPFFSSWTVHHQLDWFLVGILNQRYPDYSGRIHSCSHYGALPCAVSRGFEPGSTRATEICNICKSNYNSYFSTFPQASKVITVTNNVTLAELLDQIRNASWYRQCNPIIRAALNSLIKDVESLSELTALTNFRISRQDLYNFRPQWTLYYSTTILAEAINIIYNWSKALPDSIVLFNGRLSPYIAPYYLAKILNIPIYVHERGTQKSYSIYYNEYPSTGLCAQSVLQRIKTYSDLLASTNDNHLMTCLRGRFQEIKVPSNYPDLFGNKNLEKYIQLSNNKLNVLYLVSSEDEADTYPGSDLANAQRTAITSIINMAKKDINISCTIKSHPNIYGVHGYPGMLYSATFIDQLEQATGTAKNIRIIGREKNIDPFSLVEESDIIFGLHSSLLEYAWFHGKHIVTTSKTESANIASSVINFCKPEEIDHFITSYKKRKQTGMLRIDAIRYLLVKYHAFDFSVSEEIAIGDDYFSPKYSIDQLKLNSLKPLSEDIKIILDCIMNKKDVNLELFKYRLCNIH